MSQYPYIEKHKDDFIKITEQSRYKNMSVNDIIAIFKQNGVLIEKLSLDEIKATLNDKCKNFSKNTEEIQLLYFYLVNMDETGKDCPVPDPINSALTFDTIIGATREKKDLEDLIINPYIFPQMYRESTKGFILYGPPGTGKTLFAKTLPAQLNSYDPTIKVSLFSVKPSDLKGRYEGETEEKIANIFACAGDVVKTKKANIAFIFIDEMESIAGSRSTDDPSMVRSVNALLQEMDGVKSQKGVAVIAASNYPWKLDEAILRRFDQQIFIDLPFYMGRFENTRQLLLNQFKLEGQPLEETFNFINQYLFIDNSKYLALNLNQNETLFNLFAHYIAFYTGPHQSYASYVRNRLDAKEDQLQPTYKHVGYSQSDIKKLVSYIFRKSNNDLLSKGINTQIYVLPIQYGANQYYIYNNQTYESSILMSIQAISKNLINLYIPLNVIKNAFETIKSTIIATNYLSLLSYYKNGTSDIVIAEEPVQQPVQEPERVKAEPTSQRKRRAVS